MPPTRTTLQLITSDPHDAPARFVHPTDWHPTMPQRMPFTPVLTLSHAQWTALESPRNVQVPL